MANLFPGLSLQDYRSTINLDQAYEIKEFHSLLAGESEEVVDYVLEALGKEGRGDVGELTCQDYLGKRRLLRALLNVRPPQPMNEAVLHQLNRLLRTETLNKGIVEASSLETIVATVSHAAGSDQNDKFVLWQGDITQLKMDAIVNAANSQLLGCFQPLHVCIDNAIHSAAGPQLREDCHTIMRLQGAAEKTGTAKVTRAYNLPSKYVLHTVGPIVPRGAKVTDRQRLELASSYTACLDLANQVESIKTIAFCAISTGVFGFPKNEAAEIAVNTVVNWINKNPGRFDRIVFCVYSEEDYREYNRVFKLNDRDDASDIHRLFDLL